jgi:N-acetylmuramoyl-L-alanine amidase
VKNKIAIIFLICQGLQSFAQKPPEALSLAPYLEVTAKTGDNVPVLLGRYHLDDAECNFTKFFKINQLRDGDYRLKSGKTYKLPVQVVQYNGKSIRSTLGIDDWNAAKHIDAYNKNALREGMRSDNFVTSRNLWVPWSEVGCSDNTVPMVSKPNASNTPKRPTVEASAGASNTPPATNFGGEPTSGDSRQFPIFGSAYARTPLISNKLRGKVFFLVSGHGGPDPGAQGKRAGATLCEDEYAYDVTLRLLRLLISHGATAYMIVRDPNDGIRDDIYLRCDQDEVAWGGKRIPLNQKERLGQRTDIINGLAAEHRRRGQNDQTIIEIHVDSRSVATETDVFFYYRNGSEPSQALALLFHETFIEKYRQKRGPSRRYTGTVSTRDLFTLRETSTPKAVYLELANIQNDWDQQRIVLKNNRQAIANWLAQALMK